MNGCLYVICMPSYIVFHLVFSLFILCVSNLICRCRLFSCWPYITHSTHDVRPAVFSLPNQLQRTHTTTSNILFLHIKRSAQYRKLHMHLSRIEIVLKECKGMQTDENEVIYRCEFIYESLVHIWALVHWCENRSTKK